jgi:hypothetical protein
MRLCDAVQNIPLPQKLWSFHHSTLDLWAYMNTRQVMRAAPAGRITGSDCVPRGNKRTSPVSA